MCTDDEGVLVTARPVGERMHCARSDLLRITTDAPLPIAEVENVLHEAVGAKELWVDTVYADGRGHSLVVSVLVYNLQFFQRLRESILLGHLEAALKNAFGGRVGLDKSLFARQYAAILMEFDELTLEQKRQFATWGDHEFVGIEGPAGE